MSQSQPNWRNSNTQSHPAPESELLDEERVGEEFLIRRRPRVMAVLEARVDGVVAPVPEQMIVQQQFTGLSFVGVVGSLLPGLQGLFAQSLWFSDDKNDWFWARIDEVLSMQVRCDAKFRGGSPCVWIETPVGEYALTTPRSLYDDHWESVLEEFGAPRCDELRRSGRRPNWWTSEYAQQWPYDRALEEHSQGLTGPEELQRLTENLSVQPGPSAVTWRRLGPKGNERYPGQPLHHLDQLSEWEIALDSGRKLTRDALELGEVETIGEGSQTGLDSGRARKRAFLGKETKRKGSQHRQRKA